MKKTLLIATALAGLAIGAGPGMPAFAQGMDRTDRTDRDRGDRMPPSANQIVDHADARIARFKAELRLTPEQSKNWDSLQNALHDIAVARADRWVAMRDKMREEREKARAEANRPRDQSAQTDPNAPAGSSPSRDQTGSVDDTRRGPNEINRIRQMADEMSQRATDARKIADAAQPLYDSLDDRQRRQFARFIRESAAADRDMMGEMRDMMERRGRGWDRDRDWRH